MNFFITNREIKNPGKPNESIREDGKEHAGDNLRFGSYDTTTKNFTLFPEPDTYAETGYDDLNDKKTNDLKGSARFFKSVYDALCEAPSDGNPLKTDILFFIHGFNTDLKGARDNFKTLEDCYVKNPASPIKHIIIFTWPGRSPDIPYHYFDDKKDAIRSGEALARCMDKLVNFFKQFLVISENAPCGRNIHLMAHSMGNRVLKHFMLNINTKPEIFKEVILIAADVEYDIFEPDEAFNTLINIGERIHVIYHKNDMVLDISKYTKNFSNRLGRYGRKRVDPTLEDVFDIDATIYADDPGTNVRNKLLNHWYYYTSTSAINRITDIFNGIYKI